MCNGIDRNEHNNIHNELANELQAVGDGLGLTLKLHYGTTPEKWAKAEVTMPFLGESY